MKNLFKKEKTALALGDLSSLLTSGAAAGMTVAKYAGKDPKIGGIIGSGLSLLVTGLLMAIDDNDSF